MAKTKDDRYLTKLEMAEVLQEIAEAIRCHSPESIDHLAHKISREYYFANKDEEKVDD